MNIYTSSQSDRLNAALDYARKGWPVLPLKGKKPLTKHGVKDASRDEARITEWWTMWPDANIGLATGAVSGRLVLDIDIKKGKRGDESLRVLEAEHGLLPKTLKSQTASGGSHFVFRMPDVTVKSRNGVREGIDLLSDGKYFVAAPSTIDGKTYQWVEQCEAASCPSWVAALGQEASAPKAALSEDRIPTLVRELLPHGAESNGYWMAKCPYHEDHEPSLSITLQDGRFRCFACPARGDLSQLYAKVRGISEEEAREIISPTPDYVRRLNERYAVVSLEGQEVILAEKYDWQGHYVGVAFSSPSDLTLRYENERIRQGRKDVSIAEAWRRHPRRRQYERVIFEPGVIQAPGSFNLWRGLAVEPKEGDCSLYLAHLFENICNRDQRLYEYVVAWMADAVQHPRSKPGVAIVLRGKQGTGKSVACTEFGKLFGHHFVTISQQRQMLGNFNGHLKDKLMVLAEEAFWAGNHDAEGALKELITGGRMMVELKGREAFPVNNYIRVLICSNHDWVIPAGPEERRFMLLDVGPARMQDHTYFEALLRQMNEGGREALLHFLLHHDFSKVNVRQAPQTHALIENKLASMAPTEKFIYEVLDRGRWSRLHEGWEVIVPCHEVHTAYIEHAARAGLTRKSYETELGKALRRLLPYARKRQVERGDERVNAWEVPDLITCRKHFDEVMRWAEHEWSLPETRPVQDLSAAEMKVMAPYGVHF